MPVWRFGYVHLQTKHQSTLLKSISLWLCSPFPRNITFSFYLLSQQFILYLSLSTPLPQLTRQVERGSQLTMTFEESISIFLCTAVLSREKCTKIHRWQSLVVTTALLTCNTNFWSMNRLATDGWKSGLSRKRRKNSYTSWRWGQAASRVGSSSSGSNSAPRWKSNHVIVVASLWRAV